MKLSAIFREAGRNTLAGTSRALVGLIAFVAILLGTIGIDAHTATQSLIAQRSMATNGSATVTVSAQGEIDPQRCLALAQVAGVTGAAALRPAAHRLPLSTLPGTPPLLYESAGDLLATIGGEQELPGGIFVASQLAQQLQVTAGDALPLDGSPPSVLISSILPYPDDGRDSILAAAVIQPVPAAGAFDECWYTVWPYSERLQALALTTLAAGADPANAGVSRLNTSTGELVSTEERLSSRTTTLLPLLAAVLSFTLAALLIWTRRVELALAQHLGVSRTAQTWQLLLESLTWATPAALLASTAVAVTQLPELTAAEASWVITHTATGLGASLCAVLVGTLAASMLIHERQLYSWSKDR